MPTSQSAIASPPTAGVLKLITFTAAQRLLALPIGAVLRVINCPPTLDQANCLITWKGQVLSPIKLDRLLASASHPLGTDRFLIVAQDHCGRCCAIAIGAPPNLVELPAQTLQPLPSSYRHSEGVGLVSHIAVWTQAERTQTIFLIDLESDCLAAAKAPAQPALQTAVRDQSC